MKQFFNRKETSWLFFCVGLFLLVLWPFLGEIIKDPAAVYVYFFVTWGAVILGIVVQAHCASFSGRQDDTGKED